MEPQIVQYPPPQKSKRRIFIVVLVLVVAVFLSFFLINRSSFNGHSLTRTYLNSARNHGYVTGSDLLLYNGLSFQSINYMSGESSVLASGFKLPRISQVTWSGKDGALLNFDASFLLTDVERELAKMKLEVNKETKNYTWYMDFSTKRLHLVDQQLVATGLATYSPLESGFYYITFSGNKSTLSFYHIPSNTGRVVVESLDLVDISSVSVCESMQVCLIARNQSDPSTEKLFVINEGGEKREQHNSMGRLFATSDSARYVSIVAGESVSSERGRTYEEEIEFGNRPAALFSLGDSSLTPLGFDVGESDIVMGFLTNDEYYVLDNSSQINMDSNSAQYLTGKVGGDTKLLDLNYSTGEPFNSGLATSASFSDHGVSLLVSSNNEQLLFGSNLKELSVLSSEQALSNSEACVSTVQANSVDFFEEDKNFRIYITNDKDFINRVEAFSNCILESNTLGFNYDFAGLDPTNGKLVTD